MKKFISLAAAAAVLVVLSGCREIGAMEAEIPESGSDMAAKVSKDSLGTPPEVPSADGSDSLEDEADPPKKDDIKW
ncbi:MAG: hypothetical protein QM564_01425 [Bergeyella sp.]